jgi:nucleotide-binding universal stress UspA family protein
MVVLKSVLVATDFSEPSRVALDYGRDLARSYGATLHVLHVVDDMMLRYSGESGFVYPDLQDKFVGQAQRDLEALITSDDRTSIDVVPVVQTNQSIVDGITSYAKEKQIDLIVMGTHGRGPIKHLILGSVAERVVRTAPCPVLTVRSPEHEFIVPDAMVEVAAS